MVTLKEQFEQKKKEHTIRKREDYNNTVTTLNKQGGVAYFKQAKLQGKSLPTLAKENNTTTDNLQRYLKSKKTSWQKLPSPVNEKRKMRLDIFRETLLTPVNHSKLLREGLTDRDILIFFHFHTTKEYEEYIKKLMDQEGGKL